MTISPLLSPLSSSPPPFPSCSLKKQIGIKQTNKKTKRNIQKRNEQKKQSTRNAYTCRDTSKTHKNKIGSHRNKQKNSNIKNDPKS